MREIRFRGKTLDGLRWVYGDLIQENSGRVVIRTNLNTWAMNNDVNPYGESLDVIPDTVGQYTGFKDRTGMDIYEGDIIRYMNNGVEESVVKYECAEFSPLLCLILTTIVDNGRIECDIIGNIHDNPELLEDEE